MATGASFASLAFSFRLGKSTVGLIVKETTQTLWEELFPVHMPPPTKKHFEEVAAQYWNLWNFPNCIGAIDGKHIRIKFPASSGSMFYNYKHFFPLCCKVFPMPTANLLRSKLEGMESKVMVVLSVLLKFINF